MQWNEGTIGRMLVNQLFNRKCLLICPNSYFTGFEADLLGVTTDRRLIDVEIKISRADLKADKHKDKWLRPGPMELVTEECGWGPRPGKPMQYRRSTTVPCEHARRIWKHYYALPAEIWDDKLLPEIQPTSGIILLSEDRRDEGTIHENVRAKFNLMRRAKTNKQATRISEEEILDIARLVNLRYWSLRGS